MPATFDDDFALWLTQHGSERAVAVNVLEFAHTKWGSLYVSDYGDDFTFTKEAPTATVHTATPLGIVVEVGNDTTTTEQHITIRLDNVDGAVAAQLRSLTDEDLQDPVRVTYRVYLDTKPAAPVIDPLLLYVVSVSMTRSVVECEASADYLPNVSSGSRYTFERFPSMAFL